MLIEHLARLQIEAAESEEVYKGHMTHLEQRRNRELERKRDSHVCRQLHLT